MNVYACVISRPLKKTHGEHTQLKRAPPLSVFVLLSCFSFHHSSLLTSICFSPSTVRQNRGDRQHPKPWLCQKVHLGLLFWREAEPPLRLVSDFPLKSLNHWLLSCLFSVLIDSSGVSKWRFLSHSKELNLNFATIACHFLKLLIYRKQCKRCCLFCVWPKTSAWSVRNGLIVCLVCPANYCTAHYFYTPAIPARLALPNS